MSNFLVHFTFLNVEQVYSNPSNDRNWYVLQIQNYFAVHSNVQSLALYMIEMMKM